MVNPSLKAKIEAAKTALEKGENSTPIAEVRHDSTSPKTGQQTTPESEQTSLGRTKMPINAEPGVAMLDARITNLESKLAENQRDLYTLLGKIREVTRLQNNANNSNRSRNIRSNDSSLNDQNETKHRGRKIAITVAVLTGIILGTSFFFITGPIDQHFEHIHTWTTQFVGFISDVAR